MSEAEDRKDETKADPAVDAQDSDAVMQDEVRDTDINFDCPHCGANQVIDYRGAGLEVRCTSCGEKILVPIPDGMLLSDLDLDVGEVLQQLFTTRRNFQKAELKIQELKGRLTQLQETLGVMQDVVAEGLSQG